MLEVGNLWGPLADAEGRSHMSMWVVMKAPLLIGTDVTNMTAATLATLSNPDVIAINKDVLGVQARLLTANTTGTVAVAEAEAEEEEEEEAEEIWVWATEASPPDGGWTLAADGTLKHAPEGLCLTAQARGASGIQPLTLDACAAKGSATAVLQEWELEPATANLRLKAGSKKCLALWGGAGPGVVIYACNSGKNE